MKPKLICVAKLAQENVRIFEKPDLSEGAASFQFAPGDGGTGEMMICLKGRTWHDVLSALMHEAMEAQIHRLGLAYEQSLIPRYDAGGFLFIFDHKRFSEMTDWAAMFICECHNEVKNAWKKSSAKKKA